MIISLLNNLDEASRKKTYTSLLIKALEKSEKLRFSQRNGFLNFLVAFKC